MKAYSALDRYRGDAPFRPWLLRIVANEARNRRRAERRRASLAVRLDTANATASSSGVATPSPEEEAISAVCFVEPRDRWAPLGRASSAATSEQSG